MIYIEIYGGLGNQMFQFACAINLAKVKNAKVGVSLKKINNPKIAAHFTKREFELTNVFQLENYCIVEPKAYDFISAKHPGFINKIKRKITRPSYLIEEGLDYQVGYQAMTKTCYLSGYFQSYKYFYKNRELILKNFSFRQNLNSETKHLMERINGMSSVAIHVRRGDYVSSDQNLKTHGVCSPAYYHRALEYFKDRFIDQYLFLSDDPEWVKTHLVLPANSTVVDWNIGKDSWQDMYIMSKSTHAIIANSSFSWWGAYLINNQNKIVIAPSRWYADPIKQNQTGDLLPPEWIKLDI